MVNTLSFDLSGIWHQGDKNTCDIAPLNKSDTVWELFKFSGTESWWVSGLPNWSQINSNQF